MMIDNKSQGNPPSSEIEEQVFVTLLDKSLGTMVPLTPDIRLLPQVDFVALKSGDEIGLLSWSDFIKGAGSQVVFQASTYPPLFRADGDALTSNATRWKLVAKPVDQVLGSD